jgi:hypothetical protein
MNPVRYAAARRPIGAPQTEMPRQSLLAETAGAPQGGAGFNSLAAGNKTYGGGRPMPNLGKVQSKAGYGLRDSKMAARREALMRRSGGM